jgi:SAM-dependent methyltransferase
MKLRLLEYLVCPACFQVFKVSDTPVFRRDLEIMEGRLICIGCGREYAVTGGVPQLLLDSDDMDVTKVRTAESFGLLWSRTTDEATQGGAHSEKTLAALSLPPPIGLILDAGCGDGSDTAALAAQAAAELVGVDISEGGTHAAFERTRAMPNAHVVRADLCRLPFRAARFAFIYSYGVLHHVPVPVEAMAELARVSRPGATAAVYLYEDFSERARVLRVGLRATNAWRRLTTRLPHPLLYALCTAAAPFVYLAFTMPHRVLSRLPSCRFVAAGLPFRHGRSLFSLTGDLYDRFSAPVEYRYSRQGAAQLARDVGFSVRQVHYERGWMLELRRKTVR